MTLEEYERTGKQLYEEFAKLVVRTVHIHVEEAFVTEDQIVVTDFAVDGSCPIPVSGDIEVTVDGRITTDADELFSKLVTEEFVADQDNGPPYR